MSWGEKEQLASCPIEPMGWLLDFCRILHPMGSPPSESLVMRPEVGGTGSSCVLVDRDSVSKSFGRVLPNISNSEAHLHSNRVLHIVFQPSYLEIGHVLAVEE